ncbi:NAD(P)H-binding protein, partial [Streptomyces albidoflavus]|nr:NAD(P)H-binding protein [Streptomyces albidoflavus]
MRITVFGATGGVGGEVVRQALEAGHEVTAVVRDPAALKAGGERLEVARVGEVGAG